MMYKKRIVFAIAVGAVSCILLVVIVLCYSDPGTRKTHVSNLYSTVSEDVPVTTKNNDSREPDTTKQEVPVPVSGIGDAKLNVQVEADDRTVTAVDGDGKIKWSVDVIARCGEPFVGSPVIRDIQVKGEKVSVIFGKHSQATINIKTGEVHYLGAD